MVETKTRAWDIQDRESKEHFEMFELYLRERNIRRVADILYPGGMQTALDLVTRVSQRWNWKKRADAYDRWVAKQRDDAIRAQVQLETKLITGYRIEMVKDLYKKVKRYGKQLDRIFGDELDAEGEPKLKDGESPTLKKVHSGLVKGYAEMVKITDDLWRGIQKDNPAEQSADSPLAAEKQSAAARLEAFIEKQAAVARAEAEKNTPASEIRQ